MCHSHCNTLQHTATHCNTTHGNTRQHTTTHKSHRVSRIDCDTLTATHCNTLQHIATHCNTLQVNLIARSRLRAIKWVKFNGTLSAAQCSTVQHTATHCNTLQHTATHRKWIHKMQFNLWYDCKTMCVQGKGRWEGQLWQAKRAP